MKKYAQVCILSSLALVPAKGSIVINEIFYAGSAGNDKLELLNTGASSVDISSWWICSRFSYTQLSGLTLDSGSLNIGAGQITTLTINFDVNDTAADFGLFSTPSFGSASAMQDFVQWGTSTLVGRSNVAVAKGIWGESAPGVYDFVATAGTGDTVQFSGSGDGVSSFGNAANSIGSANIPEPSSTALLGLGGVALLLRRRK